MNKLKTFFVTIFSWIGLQFSNFKQWLVSLFTRNKETFIETEDISLIETGSSSSSLGSQITNYDNEAIDLLDTNAIRELEPSLFETEVQQKQTLEDSLYDGKYDFFETEVQQNQLPDVSLEDGKYDSLETEIQQEQLPDVSLEDGKYDSLETEIQLNQLPVVPLYDGKYDSLFDTTEVSVPVSIVHEEIWDVIYDKLPKSYTIPATSSKNLYANKQTYYV